MNCSSPASCASPTHTPEEGISAARAALREFAAACGAFEWITLGYLTFLSTLILIFHRHVAHPARYILIHAAILAAMFVLARSARICAHPAIRFARSWYPLPLYIFCFEELRSLVHIVFPGWFDPLLVALDYSLFGQHPAVWLARFSSPAFGDFMQAAYMTYFLFLVALPALLYARREDRAFWTVMTSTAIAHYTVYVIAVFFPIESPHFALAALPAAPLAAGPATHLINSIERFGRVHGAAFPSAHVSGSMVAILASWRYRRWLFWICLPFFVCMMVATVYGRYHYVADVFAGMLTGTFAYALGLCLMTKRA
ncbi:MAG: phosphatase PAP2 family protein [Candidatus Acidiferrales bacterium]